MKEAVLAILTVGRVASVKFATNRELSGRGASKRIDAEILSVIMFEAVFTRRLFLSGVFERRRQFLAVAPILRGSDGVENG